MEKETKKKDNLILVLAILILIGIGIFGIAWYLVTNKSAPAVSQPTVELEDDSTQRILEDLDNIDVEAKTFEEEFKTLDEEIEALQ